MFFALPHERIQNCYHWWFSSAFAAMNFNVNLVITSTLRRNIYILAYKHNNTLSCYIEFSVRWNCANESNGSFHHWHIARKCIARFTDIYNIDRNTSKCFYYAQWFGVGYLSNLWRHSLCCYLFSERSCNHSKILN